MQICKMFSVIPNNSITLIFGLIISLKVELSTTGHSETAIFVDTTPPIKGIVADGEDGNDLEYFKDGSRVSLVFNKQELRTLYINFPKTSTFG